jgi:hypothetical protein
MYTSQVDGFFCLKNWSINPILFVLLPATTCLGVASVNLEFT